MLRKVKTGHRETETTNSILNVTNIFLGFEGGCGDVTSHLEKKHVRQHDSLKFQFELIELLVVLQL